MADLFSKDLGSDNLFYWINNKDAFDEFDGLLFRGDRNPNSKGVLRVLADRKAEKPWEDLVAGLKGGQIKSVVVLGPENISVFPDFEEKVRELSQAEVLIWGTACLHPALDAATTHTLQIPLRTFVEKTGTFVNFQGKEQVVRPVRVVVDQAVTGEEFAQLLKGDKLDGPRVESSPIEQVKNEFVYIRGEL